MGLLAATHLVLTISNPLLLCEILCDASHMATNLAIDPDLLNRAVAISGERTKTAAVKRALEEFIARRQQSKIADLFGTLEWDPKYDYKAARSRD
jgi:Arc/MetJ family transcription regulator